MILVTAVGGFLGFCLIDQLCHEGFRIRAGLRNERQFSLLPSGVGKVVVDIRNKPNIMEVAVGCEVIVHLSGKAHAFDERGSDQDYEMVNVEGKRNVLDTAVASEARRMVFISSVKVFGEETQGCVDEMYPANPQNPYGRLAWRRLCQIRLQRLVELRPTDQQAVRRVAENFLTIVQC